MLRSSFFQLIQTVRKLSLTTIQRYTSSISEPPGEEDLESYADIKFEAYFKRPEIDGWEVRKGMNDILGMDMVPYPTTVIAALEACRRINDFALTVRWLEGVCHKTGPAPNPTWTYIVHEIKPCLEELGANIPEELCYNHPKLALKSVFEL